MAGAEDLDRNVINVWSGPRCVSTSLMYSFAQRGDTQAWGRGKVAPEAQAGPCSACPSNVFRPLQVVDEPLYAAYLRLTGAERPYREQVLASQDNDGARVVAGLLLGPRQKKVGRPPPAARCPLPAASCTRSKEATSQSQGAAAAARTC